MVIARERMISISIVLIMILSGIITIISIPGGILPIDIVQNVNASFAGGDGSESNPYQISNVTQLQEISSNFTAHYIVVNDIDASETVNWNNGKGFEPIGDYFKRFNGSLNGQGYNITDIFFNRPNWNDAGIFGYLSARALLCNIRLINHNITAGRRVGALVGYNIGGNITNCDLIGSVNGDWWVGGLIGDNAVGNVSNCSLIESVRGVRYVGGLIGNNHGKVINCTNDGDVNGTIYSGGLLGISYEDVSNCSFHGYVNGSDYVGGLVGSNVYGDISNCSTSGFVRGKESVGGLNGQDFGPINNCSSTSRVIGNTQIGGLVGFNREGNILFCYSTGNITGGSRAGGIVGWNLDGTMMNCSATGSITGSWNVGGLAGAISDPVINCYSSGPISGTESVGGLIGNNGGLVSFSSSTSEIIGHIDVGGLIGRNSGSVTDCSSSGMVSGSDSGVGGLVGRNNKIISNCFSNSDVAGGTKYSGGLVGSNYGSVSHSASYGNINGSHYIGGSCGVNLGSAINNCTATGNITGGNYIGGLIGSNDQPVYHCSSEVNISGNNYTGGLIGKNFRGNLINCTVKGNIAGVSNTGGLIGTNLQGSFKNCISTGSVNGTFQIGGFIGYNDMVEGTGWQISNCSSTSEVNGVDRVGGFIGYHEEGRMFNCTAYGNVIGKNDIGGFIGYYEDGMISSCSSLGNVLGDSNIGGMIGFIGIGEVFNSYYCIDDIKVNYQNYVTPYGIYSEQYTDWIKNNKSIDIDDYFLFDSNSGHYQISTVSDVKNILPFYTHGDYKFKQEADIDLVSDPGLYIPMFESGKFNGSGFFVKNLNLTFYNNSKLGLFGTIGNRAVVENVIIYDAKLNGADKIGGLSGKVTNSIIARCYTIGQIQGNDDVGGLIGSSSSSTISSCSSSAEVDGISNVGGLIGYTYQGSVFNSSGSGNVTGFQRLGGLIGYSKQGSVTNCFGSGNVMGSENIGGFIGMNKLMISNCYSTGDINGVKNVGGFVGRNMERIINCYSIGEVVGNSKFGGLIGNNSALISNCFWDFETSGRNLSDGGIGENSTTMKYRDTYNSVGWNFTKVWDIINEESYPYLRSIDYGIPIIITNEIKSVYEDSQYRIDFNATSLLPGGMGAKWKFESNAGNWLGISENGVLSGTPSNDDVGKYWVNITASLNTKGYNFINYTLTVYNINDDPVITTDALPDATEDEAYSFILDGFDIDPSMDDLDWSIETDADFLVIDPITGNLTGTPTNSDIGTWLIIIRVSDGQGGSHEVNLLLKVLNINDDPEIQPLEVYPIFEDIPFFLDFHAIDIDPTNDNLRWSIKSNASFIRIDQITGNLTGLPENNDVGNWWVLVRVIDGNGGFDEVNLSLLVINVNDKPDIVEYNYPEILEDEPFYIDLNAVDIDPTEDILEWSLETDASFLSLDPSTGNLSGIPTNNDVGKWWVNVTVSDGNGGDDFINFTIEVINVNDAPKLNQTTLSLTLEEDSNGTSIDLNEIFLDIDGDALSFKVSSSDNLTITLLENIVEIIPKNDWGGQDTITLTASDEERSISLNISIEVLPINDAPSDVEIIAEYSFIEGQEQIVNSSAKDVDIPYGDVLSFSWHSNISGDIGEGKSINLSLSAGHHLITLTVTDSEGLFSQATMEIDINPIGGLPDDDDDDTDGEENESVKISTITIIVIAIVLILIVLVVLGIFMLKKKPDEESIDNTAGGSIKTTDEKNEQIPVDQEKTEGKIDQMEKTEDIPPEGSTTEPIYPEYGVSDPVIDNVMNLPDEHPIGDEISTVIGDMPPEPLVQYDISQVEE